ncbi:hypothetical protein [Puniceicoccus vermicola]|uniref:DUF3108 domain-containing protein n=1 Tax=Puniceicoccus vermicola TaxID=388746 RepID=A0A7X1E479_9BACT|nr:hypothetical protein [Puniceicoccus vermicola]MBC2601713.1 hypothetical protein [Puniceicoccus vermicola]
MKTTSLGFLAILSILLPLHSQEAPVVQTTLSFAIWYDGVNLRPLIRQEEPISGLDLYVLNQEKVYELSAPFGHFGRTLNYQGSKTVPLYDRPPNPSQVSRPVALIQLEEATGENAVLLFPDLSQDTIRYQAKTFDSSLNAFPRGSLCVANFFSTTLYLKIGENPVRIDAHQTKTIRVTDQLNRGISLLAVVKEDGSNRTLPLIQRRIRMNPEDRLYLFIAPHPTKPRGATLRIMNAPKTAPEGNLSVF